MSTLTQATTLWSDPKRYLWLLSPILPALGLLVLALYSATGIGIIAWGGPLLVYAIIPLCDRIFGADTSNPPESAVNQLESDRYYRMIVYSYIPAQFVVTVWGAYLAVTMPMPTWELIGLILSVGAINGIAINTSHELGHKRESLDRWLAKLTLAPVAYGHFFVEHNRGHHKNVATPEDPASSKLGESFWQFLPRTVIGSVISAWHIEKERLGRMGKSVWSLENDNFQAWAMTIVFYAAVTAWLGKFALLFLVLQAIYGFSLLEVVNYLEHYGLLRQKGADGRYVRCQPEHSWNSNHIVTNLFLYQLQRHSDHHAHPTRSFQALRHFENSSQLPSGYASMLIPAYIPFWWFSKMDPLVRAHYKGDLRLANILPSKRSKYLSDNQASMDAYEATQQPLVKVAPVKISTQYRCPDCSYVYDEKVGCEHEGFPAGTKWEKIPDTWACPDCAVREKVDFEPV